MDLDEFGAQVFGVGEPSVGAFGFLLYLRVLAVDPVAETGIDQLLQRVPTLAVGPSEAVVVHQRVEPVSAAVPDVPDKGPVMEQLQVLGEELVAEPVVERLARRTRAIKQAGEFRCGPFGAEGIGQQRSQPFVRRGFTGDGGEADDAVAVRVALQPVGVERLAVHEAQSRLARPEIAEEARDGDLKRRVPTARGGH